jgi:predicted oxidoreductase
MIQKNSLGEYGPKIGCLGYGAMVLEGYYGASDDGQAKELDVTPAQLALSWLLHQGKDIFPIPGTRRPERIDENAKAADINLSDETLKRINDLARPGLAEGATLV